MTTGIERGVDGDEKVSGELLTSLLRNVSRSFYLTLRVLPRPVRRQIGLAYLLARTSDTIADTDLVALEDRLTALQLLREHIAELPTTRVDFNNLAPHQGSPAERVLLARANESLNILRSLDAWDRERVKGVLATIISGQELDLRRFAGATKDHVIALKTEAELDDYTYRVAGCVGEFWTRICRQHLFPRARLPEQEFLDLGVRFGKGLQLTNILRDLPADLRQGRCYLPLEGLKRLELTPGNLLQAEMEPRLRPLYGRYLDLAENHLKAGWAYTHLIPWRFARVRLACAWPLLIGRETLLLLRSGTVLDPQRRIKVTRPKVRGILWRSILYYPWPAAWFGLFPEANRAGKA